MAVRKSLYFFSLSALFCFIFLLTLIDSTIKVKQAHQTRQVSIRLVKDLGLTDLSLFTEASYIRHLSLSDRHTAFKNHPAALEHFPTGSFAGPPEHLRP